MGRGPRWSQNGRGPLAHAAGPSNTPKQRRPPRPCGGGLSGPNAKEAPSPMRRGPRWSQSEGGPRAHAAGASVVPMRRRPPRPCGGGLGDPKVFPPPCRACPSKGLPCVERSRRPSSLLHPPGASLPPIPLRGALIPPNGPRGTRVYRPLCGGGWCGVSSRPPQGVPIPPRPGQDRRDSGVSAAVWGWVVWCLLKTPTGRPYPPAAQAGPEGLGCSRRVGKHTRGHSPGVAVIGTQRESS